MDRTNFSMEVYGVVQEIPEGVVITYGQIARLLGQPRCSRMVGQVLCRAPQELNLPCHRVVNSQGRLVPGWEKQRELLEQEGVVFKKNGCVNLALQGWKEIIF